jgi:hypothetical protein
MFFAAVPHFTLAEKRHDNFAGVCPESAFYRRSGNATGRDGAPQVRKLDSIMDVEITGGPVPPDIPAGNPLDGSWLASYPSDQRRRKRIAVKAVFCFDPLKESYILRRLNREKRSGTVAKLDEGRYIYRIEITDPNEMLPWFRSFMGYVYIIRSNEHDLYEKYRQCIEELEDLYGNFQET